MKINVRQLRQLRQLIIVNAAAFILILSGCYTQVESLKEYLPADEVQLYPTVDILRKSFYTDEAYEAIKDIPVVDGATPSGYAAGTSIWSSIYSFLSLSGTGRKVVYNKKNLYKQGYIGIIHEDLHHFDDMGRSGETKVWINVETFLQAYKMLSKDSKYKGIQLWCEGRANDWVPNTFGVGPASEHIAYIGMFITNKDKKPVPDYMKAVFSHILKLNYKKVSNYRTMKGENFIVIASPDEIKLKAVK